MKKIIKLFSILLILLSFVLSINIVSHASTDLDIINKYEVYVDPNFDDGSLHISISIDWTVLNDKIEGPLSWVKIGVPNYACKNIVAKTDNIKKIKYTSDEGSFVEITFDKKYYAGEKVHFEFEFDQSRMYFLLDNNEVEYNYNPGYFNEIRVLQCNLYWNKANVTDIESSCTSRDLGDYYQFSKILGYGERINISVFYSQDSFNELSKKGEYTDRQITNLGIILILSFMILFLGIMIAAIISTNRKRDPYMGSRGFGGTRSHIFIYHRPFIHRYGVNSKGEKYIEGTIAESSNYRGGHGGSGCACACACACAGGGRAGCSMKDFYHTNLSSKDIIEVTKINK